MQRYCTELTERLLKSLDNEKNVVDMAVVVEVITALEKTTVTKEVLEITRLGKYINDLRRKTKDEALAKRAKDLVRRWRDMVLPSSTHAARQPILTDSTAPALNGAKPQSPALKCFKPQSPALRGLKPQSPLLRDITPLRVLSPALSINSDHSRSPNASTNKSINLTSNHRLSYDIPTTVVGSSSQNHSTEAVPRTHSSNKRLRKDITDTKDQKLYLQQQQDSPEVIIIDAEPLPKRQRVNGENISGNLNSQVPSIDHYVEPSTTVINSEEHSVPKKRGRKKGSKSIKKQPLLEDHVKEKLASISRNPKLKTTQELLADLQARGSNSSIINSNSLPSQSVTEAPSMEDVLRSTNEQVSKFLRTTRNNSSSHRNTISDDAYALLKNRPKPKENNSSQDGATSSSTSKYQGSNIEILEDISSIKRELTVEEILAKLPPLDPSTIHWSDDSNDVGSNEDTIKNIQQEITAEQLERLHGQCIEGLNGNYQSKLSCLKSQLDQASDVSNSVNNSKFISQTTTGDEFKEWHQMLARPTYDGQILHILPYVIID